MMTETKSTIDVEKISQKINGALSDDMPAVARVEDVPQSSVVVRVNALVRSSVRKTLWNMGFKNEVVPDLTEDVERSALVVYGIDDQRQ